MRGAVGGVSVTWAKVLPISSPERPGTSDSVSNGFQYRGFPRSIGGVPPGIARDVVGTPEQQFKDQPTYRECRWASAGTDVPHCWRRAPCCSRPWPPGSPCTTVAGPAHAADDPVTLTVAMLNDADSLNPFVGIEATSFEMWPLTTTT